jgi:hypothetical protein
MPFVVSSRERNVCPRRQNHHQLLRCIVILRGGGEVVTLWESKKNSKDCGETTRNPDDPNDWIDWMWLDRLVAMLVLTFL